ncbi:TrkH family potassium uptake protein [Alicyclobacillus sp. SO9]|uniref:TrkH family potassium uptake protein n=1 Tax=Alicyclobacillus sp. SO9 TaxID=2665646 RepID=UPI0018E7135D|nr:potassium transporter TrkG [Alicyclobacillus sp. SO9]QQE77444.1 Trk family potassium uptake protein [Alicyclobacillus sp. SO9]
MRKQPLNPAQRIAVTYFALAIIGSAVLLLPIMHHTAVSLTNAVFTSASALFVTGLTTVPTNTTWTPFGDVVIAILIQIGGAGITLVTTAAYLLMGRKIPLGTRLLMAEDRNMGLQGIVRLFRNIMAFSFAIEGIGTAAVGLYLKFVYHYTWLRALAFGLFHSISSFNNAGFDLWGTSLEQFQRDPFMLLFTSALIIVGGLGFVVLAEFYSFRERHLVSLHTKIVLVMTAILLVAGTLLILAFEWNRSMGQLSWPYKILNAWFTSVSTRTAGFDSIPISHMKEVTWLVITMFMFIGASPGSTGGGIKTSTFYMLIKTAISTIRGNAEIVSGERSIPWEIAHKSLLIFLLAIGVIMSCTLVDAALEPHIRLMRIIFEEVSAFGTVGLTTGITTSIALPMKWVLIFTMYVGRIGILTFLLGIMQKSQSKVRHVQERILVG